MQRCNQQHRFNYFSDTPIRSARFPLSGPVADLAFPLSGTKAKLVFVSDTSDGEILPHFLSLSAPFKSLLIIRQTANRDTARILLAVVNYANYFFRVVRDAKLKMLQRRGCGYN